MVPRDHYFLVQMGSTLLTDNEAILKRSAKHFDDVLTTNHLSMTKLSTDFHSGECYFLPDEFTTVSETVKAIKCLSFGKVPASDAIQEEIYKAGGLPFAEKLTELFHIMWRRRSHPLIVQGCVGYQPIQTEGKSSSMSQPSGHLFTAICW